MPRTTFTFPAIPATVIVVPVAPPAVDATRVVAKMQHHAGDVEMAPPTATLPVVAGTALPAFRAATLPPSRRHVNNKALVERHIEHTGIFQTQKGTE